MSLVQTSYDGASDKLINNGNSDSIGTQNLEKEPVEIRGQISNFPPFNYQTLPLPPPWRKVYPIEGASGSVYYETDPSLFASSGVNDCTYENQITGEMMRLHPLEVAWANMHQEISSSGGDRELSLHMETTKYPETPSSSAVSLTLNPTPPMHENGFVNTGEGNGWGSPHFPPPKHHQRQHQQRNGNTSDSRGKENYRDFRCQWKESGLFGIQAYGMIIRFFTDGSTQVKFDGVDAEWIFTVLDGPYGPVDKYDLFIGAKVKVFGRHLTISSANVSVCHEIDMARHRA